MYVCMSYVLCGGLQRVIGKVCVLCGGESTCYRYGVRTVWWFGSVL